MRDLASLFHLLGTAAFWESVPVLITVVSLWVEFPRPRSVMRSWQRWRRSLMGLWMSLCTPVLQTNPRIEDLPLWSMRVTEQQPWRGANCCQVSSTLCFLVDSVSSYSISWNYMRTAFGFFFSKITIVHNLTQFLLKVSNIQKCLCFFS